jgi:dethiobiotin synthetase
LPAAHSTDKVKAACRAPVTSRADDMLDIDDCLIVESVGGLHVHLEQTTEAASLTFHNGYHTSFLAS